MRLGPQGECHLTYCTNIHPGETWPEVRGNLHRFLPMVKRQVSPNQDFGVGLRLSAAAADALRAPDALAEFKDFLTANNLYVFTINGFPYGPFHGVRVKEEVYQPDWQDEARLRYTDLLADLLADLLPADPSLEGSVSTVPGGFKPLGANPTAVERVAAMMVRHAAHLVQLRERTGRVIALALEPEPCCLLETIEETIVFFQSHLFSPKSARELGALTGLGIAAAEEALRLHLGVCYDLCHAAVEFEDPAASLRRLRDAGIRIAKLQITAGLRLAGVTAANADVLRPFNDAVYLHQVVQRNAAGLTRFVDLPQAFEHLAGGGDAGEWRVHFHVPIFIEDLGAFTSTQSFVREFLELHRAQPVSQHLEVETYTWDVLPERYRREGVVAGVVNELEWVKRQLAA
jgi:sugar phosphate isomerase/epimerase